MLSQLQIRTFPARMTMSSEPARVELRSRRGALSIQSNRARLSVDSRQARAEMGAATPELLRQEWMRDCQAAGLRVIGRAAEEGDRMAAIETDENAIVAIAAESGYSGLDGMTPDEVMAAVNVALVPSSRPQIDWQAGDEQVSYVPSRVEASWRPGRLSIEATRARVEFLVQREQQR